jgi:hypothetical protein
LLVSNTYQVIPYTNCVYHKVKIYSRYMPSWLQSLCMEAKFHVEVPSILWNRIVYQHAYDVNGISSFHTKQ